MKKTLATLALAAACSLPAVAQEWQLVWSDEFDGSASYDTSVWEPEHGFVRNHEAQWYQGENAFQQGGCLVIECRKDSINYTSSSLTTRRSFSFLYGRLEVRAKIPTASGAWPAIWLLGAPTTDSRGRRHGMPWPSCGEIDVMEFYRIDGVPHILANACWGDDQPFHAIWNSKRIPFSHFTQRDPQWAEKFHTWRMDWTAEAIRIYLDDELLNDIPLSTTVNGSIGHHENPFMRPQYLLLNLALGGDNGGPIDESALPLRYEIDYVRVYQQKTN